MLGEGFGTEDWIGEALETRWIQEIHGTCGIQCRKQSPCLAQLRAAIGIFGEGGEEIVFGGAGLPEDPKQKQSSTCSDVQPKAAGIDLGAEEIRVAVPADARRKCGAPL